MCQAEPRCAAAVWNGGTDRWCNLKWSGTKHRRSKAGEQLVQIRPPPPNPLHTRQPPFRVRPGGATYHFHLKRSSRGLLHPPPRVRLKVMMEARVKNSRREFRSGQCYCLSLPNIRRRTY